MIDCHGMVIKILSLPMFFNGFPYWSLEVGIKFPQQMDRKDTSGFVSGGGVSYPKDI